MKEINRFNKQAINCHTCGKEFSPKVKYCSPECRMEAFIVRRAKKLLSKKKTQKRKGPFYIAIALAYFLASTIAWGAPPETGQASFYGAECCRYNPRRSCPTASGESLYDLIKNGVPYVASWHYPFGTRLKVSANGKSTEVIVLDRGPAKRLNRIIDMNERSFSEICDTEQGTCLVKVEVIK